MSIQWLLSAAFLYAEIAFVVILLLPIISPKRWKKIINSRFIRFISEKAGVLFIVFLLIQIVLLLDSIREVYKYQPVEEHGHHHHAHTNSDMAREFRAQRNLYITSMCLFLWFVIKRLLLLIGNTASLIEQKETALDEVVSLRKELNKLKEKQEKMNRKILSDKSESEAKDNESDDASTESEKKPLLKADLEEKDQMEPNKEKELSVKKED